MRKTLLLPAVLVLFGVPDGWALQLRTYSSSSHDRFLGFPSSPTHNTGFIHAALDLTGVGWHTATTNRQLTFVSPKHFVGARHWRPGVGATIRCLDSGNTIRNYTVATQHDILNGSGATDLFIGTITSTIAPTDNVSFLPYLNLLNEVSYLNEPLVILGKPARGGIGTIFLFEDRPEINNTRTFQFRYDHTPFPPNSGDDDDCYLEEFDSGSPSFVLSGGQPALVGVHSLAGTSGDNELGWDTFVPHYIAELNAIMKTEGYHMTEANPSATTLSITQSPPSGVIRAGHPFSVGISIGNTGLSDANNLKLTDTLPVGATGTGLVGAGWVSSPAAGGILPARKGGLATLDTSPLTLTLTIPAPGNFNQELAISADEFAGTNDVLPLTVIESYLSWSAGLVQAGHTDDEDGDGVPNLSEYAFHGDPAVRSTTAIGTSIPLRPYVHAVQGGNLTFYYLERIDAAARGLSYLVEYSDTLDGTWQDATPLVLGSTSTPVSADLNQVALEFATGPQPLRQFHVKITLDES